MTASRFPVLVAAVLVCLTACSNVVVPGETSGTASATTTPNASSPSPGGSGAGSSPGTGASGKPSFAPSIPASSYDDTGSLGKMARTFLRASPARRLIVEVDFVQGREPSSSAMSHLQQVLSSVCDKSGGVVVQKGSAIASSRTTYSVADIKAIEQSARSRRSSGDTATMWIVYLNGSYAGGSDALGIAFEASSAAIFRDRIDDATTAVLLAAEIERAVLTHEAGHLLALVNLGYTSKIAHEDPGHPHHSKNQSSVMYWQVDDVSIRNLLGGGPPDNFDADDRADLEMLKNN